MPSPASGVTIRPELGDTYMELDLMAQIQGYIGLLLLPLLRSGRASGVFPKVKLASLLRKVSLDQLRRATDGSYARDAWEYTSDNFTCEEYGKEEVVDDRAAGILADTGGIMADQVASDRSVNMLLGGLEQSIAAICQDATTYSTQFTGVTNEWDDATNATPITDVKGLIERFEARNGFGPNVLQMNLKQARNALLTDQVQAVLGYRPNVGAEGEQLVGNVAASVLAPVLGVPRVVIAGQSWKNTVLPGATPSLSRIWSDEYVTALYVSGGQDLKAPSFGRVFAYTGDGGGMPVLVEDYYQDSIRSRVIRGRCDLHVKVIHSELLEGLSNITT